MYMENIHSWPKLQISSFGPYHIHPSNTRTTHFPSVLLPPFSVLIIPIFHGTIVCSPKPLPGGSTIPNQAPNETLLFMKCANLNKDQCLYSKSPEMLLSLFCDPENFAIGYQKIRELNDQCLGSDALQGKSMET